MVMVLMEIRKRLHAAEGMSSYYEYLNSPFVSILSISTMCLGVLRRLCVYICSRQCLERGNTMGQYLIYDRDYLPPPSASLIDCIPMPVAVSTHSSSPSSPPSSNFMTCSIS